MSHGHAQGSGTRTYQAWKNMRTRVNNPKFKQWHRYGGRSIRHSKRWERFENFLADMGSCPPGMTLDRRNNDGPYNKRNCRWATRSEQAYNKPCSIRIGGKTLRELAPRYGVSEAALRQRLHRKGTIEC